jgi:vancomycin resistance protein YoaR
VRGVSPVYSAASLITNGWPVIPTHSYSHRRKRRSGSYLRLTPTSGGTTSRRVKSKRRLKRWFKRPPRWVLYVIGAVVAVFVLALVTDSGLYYNKIHHGVSVSGRDMSGLTRDEAAATLARYVDDAMDEPITLASGSNTWTITPEEMGTKIDVAGVIESAMGVTRKSNFMLDIGQRFRLWFLSKDVPFEGSIDSAKVNAFIAEVAEQIDIPPVDAGLSIDDDGSISVVEARSGRVVDQDALFGQLKDLLIALQSTELEVPMIVKEAAVQVEDDTTAQQQAQTILGGPVTLTHLDKTWTFTPDQIASYLDYTSKLVNGVSTLVPYISAEKMAPFFNDIAAGIDIPPVDAGFDSDGTQAWVVPGVEGRAVDREKTAEALTAATFKTADRTVEVVLAIVQPDLTTAEAKAMGIKEKLAGYTTEYFDGTPDRESNVRLATQLVSDVIVAPGDIYNFEEQIGPRTEERGFKPAKGITGPGMLEDVLGGGICQVSTTLFNAAFFAGLEIVERHNHSLFIEHYPTGRDATVTTGANMQFRNNTDNYILIRGASTGKVTTFSIYGTSDGRQVSYETSEFYNVDEMDTVTVTNTSIAWMVTIIAVQGQDGQACDVVRTITWPDGDVVEDKFHSVWKKVTQEVIVGYGPLWAPRDTSTTTTATTAP